MNSSVRIVSLVPSLSETLCDLGWRDSLIGCTQFCVEPKDLHRSATRIGGTKTPDLDLIRSLCPTHILANQEENPREPVLELAKDIPTLVTFPRSPEDVPGMLRDIGRFLQASEKAEPWALAIEKALCKQRLGKSRRFLYLIWQKPYMAAGPDTYISKTLEAIGWVNAFSGPERYPTLDHDRMRACHPDIILLSSEPYPFRNRDAKRFLEEWPEAPELARIDGQLLSWFGTKTLKAIQLLQQEEAQWLKAFSLL